MHAHTNQRGEETNQYYSVLQLWNFKKAILSKVTNNKNKIYQVILPDNEGYIMLEDEIIPKRGGSIVMNGNELENKLDTISAFGHPIAVIEKGSKEGESHLIGGYLGTMKPEELQGRIRSKLGNITFH